MLKYWVPGRDASVNEHVASDRVTRSFTLVFLPGLEDNS